MSDSTGRRRGLIMLGVVVASVVIAVVVLALVGPITASDGRVRARLGEHDQEVQWLGWSPDGGTLTVEMDDGTLVAWDTRSGERVSMAEEARSALLGGYNEALSPDGRVRAAYADTWLSEDYTVRLVDAETEDELAVLEGHSEPVMHVAWSPDGAYIAGGTNWTSGAAIVWDARTGEQLGTLGWVLVQGMAFSSDGSLLAVVDHGGDVLLWEWGARGLGNLPLPALVIVAAVVLNVLVALVLFGPRRRGDG
jgi:WD40 repeat protein